MSFLMSVSLCCPPQASLGNRVRLMITGAAPVSPTVLTFLRAALGCQVSTAQRLHSQGTLGNNSRVGPGFPIFHLGDIDTLLEYYRHLWMLASTLMLACMWINVFLYFFYLQ